MKYDAQLFTLTKKEEIADGIFDFTVENGAIAQITRPGQFAHILVPGKTLRRPISVCDVQNDALRLVFEVKGDGTRLLSQTQIGQTLDILAPLGHGFSIEKTQRTAFIGGGIGVPPMLLSARQSAHAVAILGFRSKSQVILKEDFEAAGCETIVTTDDGSFGIHGLVTDVLRRRIDDIDAVCACGPIPMLKAVAALAKEYKKPCQVSLEERMGCGVGACLVCACKTRINGKEDFAHVCKDGPVFHAEEVVW